MIQLSGLSQTLFLFFKPRFPNSDKYLESFMPGVSFFKQRSSSSVLMISAHTAQSAVMIRCKNWTTNEWKSSKSPRKNVEGPSETLDCWWRPLGKFTRMSDSLTAINKEMFKTFAQPVHVMKTKQQCSLKIIYVKYSFLFLGNTQWSEWLLLLTITETSVFSFYERSEFSPTFSLSLL